MVVADAKEAAEAQCRVGLLAAQLVDHHALDRPDLLIIGTKHRGALDLVAADQIAGLAFICSHVALSSIGCCSPTGRICHRSPVVNDSPPSILAGFRRASLPG